MAPVSLEKINKVYENGFHAVKDLSVNIANNVKTIPVGIATFGSAQYIPYGTIFAASVVAVIPIGILVFIFRRFVISGLTSGAVKG